MITVDRLVLRFTGMRSSSAEPVARRIADRLAASDLQPDRDIDLGLLQRTITAAPGETDDEVADRVAGAILESLGRSIS